MESRFDPATVESRWYANWEKNGDFQPVGEGKPFSVVIPPPNVTGALHLGHALNHTIQDILVRYRRMNGRRTLWLPGTDHAGIATQAVVEKRLLTDEGKNRHDIGREALVRRIWDWKDEYEKRICGQLRCVGSSVDWTRQRFTLDERCATAVRQTFFNLFEKGLITQGKRLVNWDTHLQTAVADDEIFHETLKSHMWHFRYPLTEGGHVIIATTRPETMLGDTALAVHPDDERYKKLIGKTATIPFVGRKIPVIADGELVDMDFGTGVVKVTPAHDPNDYATGLRHKLEMINLLNVDGSMNSNAGPFEGQDRYECRKNLVKGMEELGLLEKVEDHEMPVGHSDRSKTPIEPYLSDQWFVHMDTLAEAAMEAVRDKRVKFYPERYARSYLDWLGEKRDWCISRQLWWGHRIPVWTNDTCTEKELKASFPNRKSVTFRRDESKGRWLICALADISENAVSGHKLVQDPDVLDTWFSSALWPHSTLGWPENTRDLKEFYPTSVLVTSRDIISLWVARMVVTGLENMGEIPFDQVYIHPKILDGQGRTMSKSLGNGVDPLDIVQKYGTDALRFTMAGLCTENQDARLPVKLEKQEDGREINTSDRFEGGRNFANKLWNACRFVEPHLSCDKGFDRAALPLEDRWILSRLHSTIAKVSDCLENFRFSEMAQVLYHFTWNDFCSSYLEIRKKAITSEKGDGEKEQAVAVFAEVTRSLIRLLHPLMPFVTEELQKVLFPSEGRLITSSWPEFKEALVDSGIEKSFSAIFSIVEGVRSIRGSYSLKPSQQVDCLVKMEDTALDDSLRANSVLVKTLGGLSSLKISTDAKRPALSASAGIVGGEIFIPLAEVLDLGAERDKRQKELDRAARFAEGLRKKLANERFVSNAPESVIQTEKDKLKSQEEIIQRCENALKELVST